MSDELSPMEPEPEESQEVVQYEDHTPPATSEWEMKDTDNPYIDPELVEQEAKDKKPREKMRKIDMNDITRGALEAARKRAYDASFRDFGPLQQQLQNIDHQLQTLGDDYGSEERKEQLMRERAGIINTINGPVRVAHELREKSYENEAHQIVSAQRQAVEEYPEIADRIIEMSKNLSPQQQADPSAYKVLAAQAYGEKALEQHNNRRRAMGAGGVAAGRTGTGGGIRNPVTSQEVDRLRRMGVKGDYLSQAIDRMGR